MSNDDGGSGRVATIMSTEAENSAVGTRFRHADESERHPDVELRRTSANDQLFLCTVSHTRNLLRTRHTNVTVSTNMGRRRL